MTKKILIGIFILLMGAVGIVGYNFYKNIKKPINTNMLIAVPQNAAILLREQNINALVKKITSTNLIWEELVSNTTSFSTLSNQLRALDSIVQIPQLAPFLADKSMLTSVHLSGANSYDFVFYFTTSVGTSEKEVLNGLKNQLKVNPTTRTYDGQTIYTVGLANQKLSFTYKKTIFAFSFSTILIEDVIRQMKADNSLLDNTEFAQILSTTGEIPDGNIFINHQKLPVLLAQLVTNSMKEDVLELKSYASWSALDITLKSNSIMLNGFTLAPEQAAYFASLFKNQSKSLGNQKIKITEVTPRNTAFLYYYSFSNSKQFFSDRKAWLKQQNKFFEYTQFVEKLATDYGIDIEEEFLSTIGNELAFIITEPVSEDVINYQYVIFQTKDSEQTKINLRAIEKKINSGVVENVLFNEFSISQLHVTNLFPKLFGKPFVNSKNPYYTIIDDYVVFGASESAIKTFITDYVAGRTLKNDENFQSFSDQLSANASIFIYNNIARSVNLYKIYADEKFIVDIDEKTTFLRKFEALAFQVNPSKSGLFYNNVYLKYNPVYKQDTRTLWETILDTLIASPPQLVMNHITNTKEVFVQDIAHKIYLISTNGKILWSKQLQEPLVGQVQQIDIFKNGKLQLLFNTKNNIYLLDRNGNNVGNFPILLKAEATTSVAPLDYENNRNYRLLIGCNNNQLYNYTLEGNLVDGWEYTPSKSSPSGLIKHFIMENKDYIVVTTENGKVKVVQRNGKDRLELKNSITNTINNQYLVVGNDLANTFLTSMDTSGNVIKLFFNDKLEQIKPIDNQISDFYFFSPISITPTVNGATYFYCYENTLIANDASQNKLFSLEFSSKITHKPQIFTMPDKTKRIGVVTNSGIYLLNDAGVIEQDFPLAGSTPFMIEDINNDNVLNLVVGEKNLVYMYNLK